MRSASRRVDFSQALRIAANTIALELRKNRGGSGRTGKGAGLFFLVFTYLLGGFFMGIMAGKGADPFTLGFIVSSFLMLLIATFVTTEFTTLVVGPEDYSFYLALPISLPTYVLTKLSTMCLFAAAFALAFAVPFLDLLAFRGVALPTVAGLLYAMIFSSIIISLLLTILLAVVLRFVPYRRVQQVATYFQLILLFGLYGCFGIVQGLFQNGLAALRVPLSPLLLLAPSSWSASLLRLGGGGSLSFVGFGLSLVAPPLLFIGSRRIITTFFEARTMEGETQPTASRKRHVIGARSVLWRSHEEKAMALLIANHFRFNARFRMSILMNVPIMAMMLVFSVFVSKVRILDPFTAQGAAAFGSSILLYVMIMIFPSSVKTALTYSDECEAIWLFAASPADHLLLIRAARRFLVLFFLIPYLLVLCVVYLFFIPSVIHTIQHFLVIGVLIFMETDVILFFAPELPFSKNPVTGMSGASLLLQFIPALLTLIPMYLLVVFVYPRPLLYWPVLGVLLGCLVMVHIRGKRHAAARLSRELFAPASS